MYLVDSSFLGIFGVNTPHTVRLFIPYALESTLVIPTFLTNKNQPSEPTKQIKTPKTWAKDYKAAPNNFTRFICDFKLNRRTKSNKTNIIVFISLRSICESIFITF